MLAMRDVVIGGSGGGQVPGLAVVVAFMLVVVSIAVLVLYVHHIGRSLRVSALIELVGTDTRRLLDTYYPERQGQSTASSEEGPILARRSGVLCHVNIDRLVAVARDGDCLIEVLPAFGEFVAAGSPLLRILGDPHRLARDPRDQIVLGLERMLEQDVSYGFRLLVDIAERSLSDSPFLDPTTVVQAIDRLHDCLRHLARRPFPDGQHRDESGQVRVVLPTMTWEAYVHLAFDEVRQAGAGSPQVARRLRASLQDLCDYAPAGRRAVLRDQLRLLDLAVADQVPEHEAPFFLVADRQGIGVAANSVETASPTA
jgi:uncharacterized membrane protein